QAIRSRVCVWGLAALFCVVAAKLGTAQSTASLNGPVKDASGAVIQDASLRLTNVNTGLSEEKRSNSTGAYNFVNILPGHYTLQAVREGFSTERQPEFPLEVNQTATVNFT